MSTLNPQRSAQQIHATLWEIHDVFTDQALADLSQHYAAGTIWHMDRDLARLSYPYDLSQDPLESLGQQFSAWISELLARGISYRRAKIFLDLPGSHVPRHRDAPDIDIMCQVYLTSSDLPLPGTVFREPTWHTVPYRRNHGYVNINTDLKTHESPASRNGLRASLGFQLLFA